MKAEDIENIVKQTQLLELANNAHAACKLVSDCDITSPTFSYRATLALKALSELLTSVMLDGMEKNMEAKKDGKGQH